MSLLANLFITFCLRIQTTALSRDMKQDAQTFAMSDFTILCVYVCTCVHMSIYVHIQLVHMVMYRCFARALKNITSKNVCYFLRLFLELITTYFNKQNIISFSTVEDNGSQGQGSLVCCSPWGPEKSDTSWQLSNNIDCRGKQLAFFHLNSLLG